MEIKLSVFIFLLISIVAMTPPASAFIKKTAIKSRVDKLVTAQRDKLLMYISIARTNLDTMENLQPPKIKSPKTVPKKNFVESPISRSSNAKEEALKTLTLEKLKEKGLPYSQREALVHMPNEELKKFLSILDKNRHNN